MSLYIWGQLVIRCRCRHLPFLDIAQKLSRNLLFIYGVSQPSGGGTGGLKLHFGFVRSWDGHKVFHSCGSVKDCTKSAGS